MFTRSAQEMETSLGMMHKVPLASHACQQCPHHFISPPCLFVKQNHPPSVPSFSIPESMLSLAQNVHVLARAPSASSRTCTYVCR